MGEREGFFSFSLAALFARSLGGRVLLHCLLEEEEEEEEERKNSGGRGLKGVAALKFLSLLSVDHHAPSRCLFSLLLACSLSLVTTLSPFSSQEGSFSSSPPPLSLSLHDALFLDAARPEARGADGRRQRPQGSPDGRRPRVVVGKLCIGE